MVELERRRSPFDWREAAEVVGRGRFEKGSGKRWAGEAGDDGRLTPDGEHRMRRRAEVVLDSLERRLSTGKISKVKVSPQSNAFSAHLSIITVTALPVPSSRIAAFSTVPPRRPTSRLDAFFLIVTARLVIRILACIVAHPFATLWRLRDRVEASLLLLLLLRGEPELTLRRWTQTGGRGEGRVGEGGR